MLDESAAAETWDALDAIGAGDPSIVDPLIGRCISGRFTISRLIANGGMGRVYEAIQSPLGRACAIKVLHVGHQGETSPEFHRRFFREASICSKLSHPNTVTVFDYGRAEDGTYYMAMELLEGRTLHEALGEDGPFTEERATHIARQICRSLREAHTLGVIHRDLKPANIALMEHGDEKDFVKVLDFGLVKNIEENDGLTTAGVSMGTPMYMAPEQVWGEPLDARTDVYAIGVILYELIAGRAPFRDSKPMKVLMAQVNEPVPPLRETNPDVRCSEHLEGIIFKCVEKDRDRRFASVDELLAALSVTGTSVAPTPVAPRPRKPVARIGLALAVAVGAIAYGLHRGPRPRTAVPVASVSVASTSTTTARVGPPIELAVTPPQAPPAPSASAAPSPHKVTSRPRPSLPATASADPIHAAEPEPAPAAVPSAAPSPKKAVTWDKDSPLSPPE